MSLEIVAVQSFKIQVAAAATTAEGKAVPAKFKTFASMAEANAYLAAKAAEAPVDAFLAAKGYKGKLAAQKRNNILEYLGFAAAPVEAGCADPLADLA
jgi:hypothetical protein